MSDISTSAVASLRSRTGVSILECKKVLEEANGDEEKAIELLRKRGAAHAAKKSEREQYEGIVFVHESEGKAGVLFLRCETDFVARDEYFLALGEELVTALCTRGKEVASVLAKERLREAVQKFGENISVGEMEILEGKILGSYVHSNGKIAVVVCLDDGTVDIARNVAMHAAAMNPLYVAPEEVPQEEVEKEKTLWREQLAKEGKSEEIIEKILVGKEKKFREENALLTQDFVKDPSTTVQQYISGTKITGYTRISVT
jgi:elongation factor Ts